MKYPDTRKQQVISLRKIGKKISEIVEETGVSRRTVNTWIKNISLSPEIQDLIKSRQKKNGLSKAWAATKDKTKIRREAFKKEGAELAARCDYFSALCMLYYGEGAKDPWSVGIANTDPSLLKLFVHWFNENNYDWIFKVLYYESNGHSVDEIKEWWKTHFAIEEFRFRKFTTKKEGKPKGSIRNIRNSYGVATVQVSSTQLAFQILGGIEYILNKHLGTHNHTTYFCPSARRRLEGKF